MILPKTAALWADAAVFPEAWMPFGSTAPWVHVPVQTSAVYMCLGQEVTSSFCASCLHLEMEVVIVLLTGFCADQAKFRPAEHRPPCRMC